MSTTNTTQLLNMDCAPCLCGQRSAHLVRIPEAQQEIGSLNVGVDVLVVMNIFQHVQLPETKAKGKGQG